MRPWITSTATPCGQVGPSGPRIGTGRAQVNTRARIKKRPRATPSCLSTASRCRGMNEPESDENPQSLFTPRLCATVNNRCRSFSLSERKTIQKAQIVRQYRDLIQNHQHADSHE